MRSSMIEPRGSADSGQVAAAGAGVTAGIVLNVFAALVLIIGDKFIYNTLRFHFIITLTALHFFATSTPTTTVWETMPVTLWTLISIGSVQLSLAHNSIGFYQISKLLSIPLTILLEYCLYGQVIGVAVQAALLVLVLGVSIATYHDVNANLLGGVYAAVTVVSGSISQIVSSRIQREKDIDHIQLLVQTTPLITAGLVLVAPLFDNLSLHSEASLFHVPLHTQLVVLLAVTSTVSLLLNATTFLILGKTSAVTFQVVGHIKTCFVIVLGFYMFPEHPPNLRQVIGIAVALVGAWAYGRVKQDPHTKVVLDIDADSSDVDVEGEEGISETSRLLQDPVHDHDPDLDADDQGLP